MAKMKDKTKLLLGLAGSLLVGSVGFLTLAYARSGRRGQGSPLIPDKLEHQIDHLIGWLDRRLGKEVVDRGLDALQAGLKGTAPDVLLQLLEHVFHVDPNGSGRQWIGGDRQDRGANIFGKN